MNTADIINGCRTLHGVSVYEKEYCTELELQNAEGSGCMRFFAVFPGISLAQINVRASMWPAPEFENTFSESNGPLLINYCKRGRCELVLNDNKRVFLTEGQISLTEKFAQSEYIYPGRVYDGIEIFIDPETTLNGSELIEEVFGFDISILRKKYCPTGETFIAKMPLDEALIKKLMKETENIDGKDAVYMKTGVVELFAALLCGAGNDAAQLSPDKITYYTRSQVEIARRIEKIIIEDLQKQHTVHEFAEAFSISESSVKNYFRGVFGQSISQYTAYKRMANAAELLVNSNFSVLEIANCVGYENQSKFAAAFRRVFECSPLEYRRKRKLKYEI